jgi:[histone H3]-lysine36 N-trimethyltransferase
LTNIIAEKEKKLPGYKDLKLDALSEDKQAKIKKFAKEYIVKLVRKLKKAKAGDSTSKAGTTGVGADDRLKPSTSTAASSVTPNSTEDVTEEGNDDGDDNADGMLASMDIDDGDAPEDIEMVSSDDEDNINGASGEGKDTATQSPAIPTPGTADSSPSQSHQSPAPTSFDPRRRGQNWDPQKSSLDMS